MWPPFIQTEEFDPLPEDYIKKRAEQLNKYTDDNSKQIDSEEDLPESFWNFLDSQRILD